MTLDRVLILDTTLRDGEGSPGFHLDANSKIRIARQLEKLGVDVIEAGFPVSSRGDFEACRRIAREIRGTGVTALARAVREDIDAEVNAAADAALARPQPAPETVSAHIVSPDVDPASAAFDTEEAPAFTGEPTTMVDLINAALRDEMARDARIAVWGEDVADASRAEVLAECKGKGGVFKVTAGLQKAFGPARVFNSPLAEAGIVGRAIGWAAWESRPPSSSRSTPSPRRWSLRIRFRARSRRMGRRPFPERRAFRAS